MLGKQVLAAGGTYRVEEKLQIRAASAWMTYVPTCAWETPSFKRAVSPPLREDDHRIPIS